MSRCVTAPIADEGITKLIKENKTVLGGDILNMLRSLRLTINDKVKDANNAHIVLYIEDEKYEVIVGNGKPRYSFNIPDVDAERNVVALHSQNTTNPTSGVKMKITYEKGSYEKPNNVCRTIAAGSFGAAGGALAYCALASNPVTFPLALATAGGAAINALVAGGGGGDKKAAGTDRTTLEVECSPEDIRAICSNKEVAKMLQIDNK